MEHSLANDELRQWYRDRGFGGRVGFGERPALLVIDVGRGWLDPRSPIGSEQHATFDQLLAILTESRRAGLPVIFTTMGFPRGLIDAGDIFCLKFPMASDSIAGSTWEMELEPALERSEDEILYVKPRQSAFFGTALLSHLIALHVDTVVVVGLSTSGCIRSTCEDAFNHNFRVVVPREAVGDRCRSAHEASLFDIDNRFGDVMTADEVLAYIAARAVAV